MTAGSDSRPISTSLDVLTKEIWRLPVAGLVAHPENARAAAIETARDGKARRSLGRIRILRSPGLWRPTGTAVYSNTGSRAPRFRNSDRKEPMPTTSVDLAQLSVNTIKFLSADAVE